MINSSRADFFNYIEGETSSEQSSSTRSSLISESFELTDFDPIELSGLKCCSVFQIFLNEDPRETICKARPKKEFLGRKKQRILQPFPQFERYSGTPLQIRNQVIAARDTVLSKLLELSQDDLKSKYLELIILDAYEIQRQKHEIKDTDNETVKKIKNAFSNVLDLAYVEAFKWFCYGQRQEILEIFNKEKVSRFTFSSFTAGCFNYINEETSSDRSFSTRSSPISESFELTDFDRIEPSISKCCSLFEFVLNEDPRETICTIKPEKPNALPKKRRLRHIEQFERYSGTPLQIRNQVIAARDTVLSSLLKLSQDDLKSKNLEHTVTKAYEIQCKQYAIQNTDSELDETTKKAVSNVLDLAYVEAFKWFCCGQRQEILGIFNKEKVIY